MSAVTYEAFTSRNLGFVTEAEQRRLRDSSVFVCGVGGMGGAAVESLVRAGVGRVGIADADRFEESNLNRQVFSSVPTLGQAKTDVTRLRLMEMNPGLEVETFGAEWTDRLREILERFDLVVNGMDDIRAGISLYRAARRAGITIVDAYPCPHPSVTVVGPDDPRPEERLGFPTVGVPENEISDEAIHRSLVREVRYVASVSSGIARIDPAIVTGILEGRRPRVSFAPVVIIAGNLMAFEAIRALLGHETGAGCRGYFVDPWSGTVERPTPIADRWDGGCT